jgi:hypothetical protein
LLVGVAVPFGTASGTYYQTLRLFEGYDPGSLLGVTGPKYEGEFVPINTKKATNISSLYVAPTATSAYTPEQSYSDPGAVLVTTVTETPITSLSPARIQTSGTNNIFGALSNVDNANNGYLDGVSSTITYPVSTNVQAWAYPIGGANPTGIGLFWGTSRVSKSNANYPFDIFTSSVPTVDIPGWGSGINAPQGLGSVTDASSGAAYSTLWTKPTQVTYSSTLGSSAAWAYDPSVITNLSTSAQNLLYVQALTTYNTGSTAGTAKASITTYSLIEDATAGGNKLTLYTSSQPIFYPRGIVWTGSGTAQQIITWTTRVHGSSTIMYMVYNPSAKTSSTPSALPTPAGLGEVGDATPLARVIGPTATDYNCIDVTYAARAQATNSNDIFTNRYSVNYTGASDPTTWSLALIPTGYVSEPLTTVGSNHQTYQSQDVIWDRTPGNFKLIVDGNSVAGVGGSTAYSVDPATGAWVFPNIQSKMPTTWWGTGAETPLSVTVNPYTGVVVFSGAPASTFSGTVSATVAPAALRITSGKGANTQPSGSGSNSQPSVFIDRADMPGASGVNVDRYWYIYRKTGLASTTGANLGSTLYMDTRRLTFVMAHVPVAFGSLTVSNTSGYSQSYSSASDALAAGIVVDLTRGRIYFPEKLEGCIAQVTYTPSSGTASANETAFISWMDEPYVNSTVSTSVSSDGTIARTDTTSTGERAVPVSNGVTEGEPCAFLDPLASSVNPHRVWLFWTSSRNVKKLNTTPVVTYLASDAVQGATTFQVQNAANIVGSTTNSSTGVVTSRGTILRIGRGSSAEDVTVLSVGSNNSLILESPLINSHSGSQPVSNVRMDEYVSVTNADGSLSYYTPRLDNPGTSIGAPIDWQPYTGGASIYWEALDPNFD